MKRKSIVLLILSAVLTFSLFGCAPKDESGGGGTAGGNEINLLDYFEDEVYGGKDTNNNLTPVKTTITKLIDKQSFNESIKCPLWLQTKSNVKIKKLSFDIKFSGELENLSLSGEGQQKDYYYEEKIMFKENEIKNFVIDKPITLMQIEKSKCLIIGSYPYAEIDNLKIELVLD